MSLVDASVPGARPVTVWHLVHSGVPPAAVSAPPGVTLVDQVTDCAHWSARMYAQVGSPWHWVDRRNWRAADWQEWVQSPGYTLLLVHIDGEPRGYVELVGATHIAFFGIDASATGRGIGRWLLTETIRRALARPETVEIAVHTCGLDHPAALANYQARGFEIVRTETEWRMVPDNPAQSAL
jgi:ribosomal protein S18 acetylase RimI-like enzyme